MIYVGIDPGKTGGVVALSHEGAIVGTWPMELILTGKDGLSLLRVLTIFNAPQCRYGLEKAQSMPKQGVSSTFSYGEGYGRIQGHLEALEARWVLVKPREWQKALWLGANGGTQADNPKGKSLEIARRLWPQQTWLATPRCSKPHEGMIDAALIAEWCRRTQK